MVSEGVIALIWAAAGCAFYGTTGGLGSALKELGGQGPVVYDITTKLLGPVGSVIAMIGVIACPISSGDTAFRSARLVISDWLKIDQASFKKRLALTIPILGIGALLTQMDVSIIWRYFSWSNQTLAMLALWAGGAYLYKNNRNPWMAVIPATFMSAVSLTYILMAPEGFKLNTTISYLAGILFAVVCLLVFVKKTYLNPANKKAEGTA